MEKALLEMLLHHGEDTKLDYKETVQIKSKTDYEGRAEFIRDVLSIANAHEEETGYILIGVDENAESEDERIVDIKHLGLDDADIHAFADEYISAPVPFSFRHVEYRGNTIGVIEIPFSDNRFHFVAKDYKAADSNKLLLSQGQCLIRRGSKKSPVTGYDMQRLKEYYGRKFTNAPQPDLQVHFFDALQKKQIKQVISLDKVVRKRPNNGYGLPAQIDIPLYTAKVQFAVSNEGSTEARNVLIDITLPQGCIVYDWQQFDILRQPRHSNTVAHHRANTICIRLQNITHNLDEKSDEVFVTFAEARVPYELLWQAHAGNMVKPTVGKLQVTIG